jgi:hypothetical protein
VAKFWAEVEVDSGATFKFPFPQQADGETLKLTGIEMPARLGSLSLALVRPVGHQPTQRFTDRGQHAIMRGHHFVLA